jgi:hypothetical protein
MGLLPYPLDAVFGQVGKVASSGPAYQALAADSSVRGFRGQLRGLATEAQR